MTIFIVSCQKEVSFETTIRNGGTAKYSFDSSAGACTGAVLSGTFTAGVPVTQANSISLTVDVDSIGTYIVSTNTVNGIFFSGSGTFTNTGTQTIVLNATGTPTAAGVFNFSPAVNACSFQVTVVAGGGGTGGSALYTFTGGTGACTGAVVSGVFTAGAATSSSNTVRLEIKVDQIGPYTISTNTVNGIKFTATGTFTTLGIQTVTLTASGTPSAVGNFSYSPSANACSFNVTVASGGGGGGGNYLRCKIDGVLRNFNTGLNGLYVTPPNSSIPYSVTAKGFNSDVANSIEELWVSVQNSTAPNTGIYWNGTFSSGMTDRFSRVALYPTGFPNLYWSSSAFNANTLSVTLTAVSATGATGTFQGTIVENNGIGPASKTVTDGEFKITY